MVSLADIAAGDVINFDFMHPHWTRKSFNYHQCGGSCYVLAKNFISKISIPTKLNLLGDPAFARR